MVELCGCGHANDHIGRKCFHEAPEGSGLQQCPCPFGMRSDIAMIRQLAQIAMGIQQINTNIFKILALTQATTGLQVDIQRNPQTGDVNVNVSQLNQDSGIVAASAIPNLKGVKGNG